MCSIVLPVTGPALIVLIATKDRRDLNRLTICTNRAPTFSLCKYLKSPFSLSTVFDENDDRFSMDARPKRIKMYTFSNENAFV